MAKTQPTSSWSDYLNPENYASFSPDYSHTFPVYGSSAETSPIPGNLDEESWKRLNLERAQLPYYLDAARQLAENQANLSYDQTVKLAPLIDWAAQQASNRSIAGTKNVAFFKEGLPTAAQNRMATAAFSEAQRGEALARQQDSATNLAFARAYGRSLA
jgi:hypothetical protein